MRHLGRSNISSIGDVDSDVEERLPDLRMTTLGDRSVRSGPFVRVVADRSDDE